MAFDELDRALALPKLDENATTSDGKSNMQGQRSRGGAVGGGGDGGGGGCKT